MKRVSDRDVSAAPQPGPRRGLSGLWQRMSSSPGRALPIAAVAVVVAAGLVPGIGAVGAAVAEQGGASASGADFTQYVDPFVSTEDDFGQDMPAAVAPHGLAKLNPMTTPGRSHSGYDYAEDQIAGFTLTNQDGAGGSGSGGDLLTVPTYVKYTTRPTTGSYAKNYSHDDEEASPGYYRVALTTTQGTDGAVSNTPGSAPIEAQMTADVRTALQRYTFPNAGAASLVLDLRNNFAGRVDASLDVDILDDGRASLSGYVVGAFGSSGYRLYYYAETTGPVTGVRSWGADGVLSDAAHRQGADIGAIIDVDVAAASTVGLTTTLSPISVEQARTDMGNEIGDRDFEQVRADTKAQWNDVLSTVAVDSSITSDPDGTLKKLFYTHLYRLFGMPMNATSTTGSYRGVDGVIYQADGYTHYDSWYLWDDFRKYSILALAYPEVYRDVTQSLVDLFAELANTSAGSLSALAQSVPTTRFERASVVIADAVSKGVDLAGLDLAFDGLKRQVGTGYNAANTQRGYLSNDVDDTLGTAYDDWSMSIIADALGKADDKAFYLQRATNYTNLFNTDGWTNPAGGKVGLIGIRDDNGNWGNANPEQFEAANLYQGTLWQYNWYAANDMGGMIDLMGGQDKARSAVSFLFGEQAPDDGSRMLHSNANEIDLQAPYLFNFVGQPSHTQYWARSIYTKPTWNRYIATGSTGEAPSSGGEFRPPIKDKVYELDSDGFLPTMDNDAGTMSATFVAAAMGLFPVTAGSDSYQIGSPFFEHVTIDGHNGKTFSINADDVSPDRFYIQSATLNGRSLNRTWISYDEILDGGDVTFQMGDTASEWAADGPMAYTMSDHVDSSVYDKTHTNPIASSSKVFSEATANDGTIGSTITLTATGTIFAGAVGDDLAGSAVTAANVPDGLALHAIKRSDTSLELSLSGSARLHLPSDDVDDLAVTLGASAFATPVNGAAQTIDLDVAYTGYTLVAGAPGVTADETGAVDGAVSLTLQGGATFAEASGDLIAAGTARVDGLPAGLSATLVRQDATTLALAVSGTLQAVEAGTFTIGFEDSALAGGVRAREIDGDGLSTLHPLTVGIGTDWHEKLSALYDEAHLVRQGSYSSQTFGALTTALAKARALLDAPAASDTALQQAYFTINSALDALELGEGGYRRLEAERSDSWSGGELGNEAINIGGVKPGSWVAYSGMDFAAGGGAPGSISIRYVTNSTRCPEDSAVEVRLGAPDGPIAATVKLPRNSPDWNNYSVVTQAVDPSAFAGGEDVYFVFRGSITGTLPWIANLDYFQFAPASDDPDAPVTFDRLTTRNATALHAGIDKSSETFQNVNHNEWASYVAYDFGTKGVDKLQVNYDKPSDRTTASTSVEVHFGSTSGPLVATVPLTYTGTGWGTYRTLTADVDPSVFVGKKDVYFVFIASKADGGHPYVANIGWMQFAQTPRDATTSYHLEAERFAANSGGELGIENNTDSAGVVYTNLKGTHDNDWLRYDGIDFGDETATSVTVRYANNSSRAGANSRVEVHLDSRDGAPFTTVPLPVTGTAWNTINTTTFHLPSGITGAHTIFLVLRTEPDADHPFVANIDWFDFGYGVDVSPLRTAIERYEPLSAEEDRYLAVDFRTFTRALENARAVADDAGVTAPELAAALRELTLAAGQLEWKVIRQLGDLVALSDALDPAQVTPESHALLASAVAQAKALATGSSYEAYQTAYTDLRTAYDGLEFLAPDTVAPVITLRAGDTVLRGTEFDPTAGVTALDAVDGDLTAAVVVTGAVDTSVVGSYPLEYRVSDAAGNVATAQRTVEVVPSESSDGQEVQVTVPEPVTGEFVWNIGGGSGGGNDPVDLGAAGQAGDHFAVTGAINPVRVTDTRADAPPWSLSAQVGDFTSRGRTFAGKYLGWTPRVLEEGGDAVAGAAVASGFDSGDGLSASSTLGSAARGHARGSATLGARLDLKIPLEVADGTYQATLTLTALG
ncbi:glycoside hydrolase domain-containing protein [Compostimonas suwonensis]|uniref:glycoside hydrolase domain-containing protein n=1 Tax=Compostimonas suwonensis TaxID=1048394 RepID=UPI0012FE4967|nr:glycoside hydrolase domain-containing protein [Compostimonas suwonensis]